MNKGEVGYLEGAWPNQTPPMFASATVLSRGNVYSTRLPRQLMESQLISDRALAATITKTASAQTYYTIRFLVDPCLVEDAYRAYAYFRWVDDWLDQKPHPRTERLVFVKRQQALIDRRAHID